MISSDDSGKYTCGDCGNTWRARDRYLWWPIRLHWSRGPASRAWLKTHGWQVGWDGFEQRVFGRTLHVGPLKVMFGRVHPGASIGRRVE